MGESYENHNKIIYHPENVDRIFQARQVTSGNSGSLRPLVIIQIVIATIFFAWLFMRVFPLRSKRDVLKVKEREAREQAASDRKVVDEKTSDRNGEEGVTEEWINRAGTNDTNIEDGMTEDPKVEDGREISEEWDSTWTEYLERDIQTPVYLKERTTASQFVRTSCI